MARTSKPYNRPDSFKRSNPGGPGSWKHDLHDDNRPTSSSSLASRLSSSSASASRSSSSRPSLLDRMSNSGKGKELLDLPTSGEESKLFGFGSAPPRNYNNPNAGLELLPSGSASGSTSASGSGSRNGGGAGSGGIGAMRTPRGFQSEPGNRSLVQSGVNAALGLSDGRLRLPRNGNGHGNGHGGARRELMGVSVGTNERAGLAGMAPKMVPVSILGAGRTTVLVRVENLAVGTTADDVMSAFAPLPIISAIETSPPKASTVTVDLEFQSRQHADEVVTKYNGAVADGNTLKVTIIQRGLAERMGTGIKGASSLSPALTNHTGGEGRNGLAGLGRSAAAGTGGREELMPASGSSKMYSDQILASNPSAAIQTIADGGFAVDASRARRADTWLRGGQNGIMQASNGGGSLAGRLGRGRGQMGGGMMVD